MKITVAIVRFSLHFEPLQKICQRRKIKNNINKARRYNILPWPCLYNGAEGSQISVYLQIASIRIYVRRFRMSPKYLFLPLFVEEPFSLAMAKQKNLRLDCQKNLI